MSYEFGTFDPRQQAWDNVDFGDDDRERFAGEAADMEMESLDAHDRLLELNRTCPKCGEPQRIAREIRDVAARLNEEGVGLLICDRLLGWAVRLEGVPPS